jgi:hypothetical protein
MRLQTYAEVSAAVLGVAISGPILTDDVRQQIQTLPPRITRRRGAEEIGRILGMPISHRTLEAWHLPVQRVCGKALVPTMALFEAAATKLADAPVVMSGRRLKS